MSGKRVIIVILASLAAAGGGSVMIAQSASAKHEPGAGGGQDGARTPIRHLFVIFNLVSGDTGGVDTSHMVNSPSIATSTHPNADLTPDGSGGYSLTSDAQPYWDDCSTSDAVGL